MRNIHCINKKNKSIEWKFKEIKMPKEISQNKSIPSIPDYNAKFCKTQAAQGKILGKKVTTQTQSGLKLSKKVKPVSYLPGLEPGPDCGMSLWAYNKGSDYYNEKNYKVALQYFERSAFQEDYHAQNILGYMYQNGKGTPKNLRKSVEWYHRAAFTSRNGHKYYKQARLYLYDAATALFIENKSADNKQKKENVSVAIKELSRLNKTNFKIAGNLLRRIFSFKKYDKFKVEISGISNKKDLIERKRVKVGKK